MLKGHCEDLGRDHSEISKTVAGVMYTGQPTAEVVDQAKPFAAMGFDHVILNIVNDYEGTLIKLLGNEVVPSTAEL